MSKRKLSRQQAWRVNKIQQERLKRAGKRDALVDDALEGGELGPEQEGLISAHFGTQVQIGTGSESRRCHLRANLEGLVTGDRVVWRDGDPTGVVVAQMSRTTELMRPDPYGKLKPVAANISQIFIVLAPLPVPHANLIDRYLVAAEAVNIPPTLLLNKTDLIDADNQAYMHSLLEPYAALGYRSLRASCSSNNGLEELRAALKGETSVFVGQSGVGKSSLVNVLLPEANLRVGALSEVHATGTHTTTTAHLSPLPGGGTLIDSPGIREFGLWHMERDQVEHGFREFEPWLGRCKFRDCRHEQEPGCSLLEAAERGEILPQRLASYRQIVASLEELQ